MKILKFFFSGLLTLFSLSLYGQTPCNMNSAGGFPCEKVDLLAHMPISAFTNNSSIEASDIWGWTDPNSGREFALLTLMDGTYFVEITDPINPVYKGKLPTQTGSSFWRDVKTFENYAYIVSDINGNHGMQVFDLSQLLGGPPITGNYANSAYYSGVGSAHNIFINEDTGFAYIVGASNFCQAAPGVPGGSGGLHILDINDPLNPVYINCLGPDYTHDTQCVIYDGPDATHLGKEICFNFNGVANEIVIVDVTDKNNMQVLSSTTYSGASYTHQGWLTDEMDYLIVNDETDENGSSPTKTFVLDVSDLDAPLVTGVHLGSTNARDHNLYIKGKYVYQANYRAGLRILRQDDLANAALTEVAYFDVFIGSNNNGYNGAWSLYPYFPSGTVIVSAIEDGLFILQPKLTELQGATVSSITCFDNNSSVTSDDYFTFALEPFGDYLGASFSISGDATASALSYGAPVIIDNGGSGFLISGGDLSIIVSDDDDPNCTYEVTITAPLPCSNVMCSLSSAGVSNIVCDDNGTASAGDDFYTFDLNPNGTSGTYSVGAPINVSGISYGMPTNFGGASYLISNGNLNLTITDDANSACQLVNIQITAPSTCSVTAPCTNTLDLSGNVSGVVDNEAIWIQSDQILLSGAKVDYDATDYILLKAGFTVHAGALFQAFIDGCNGGVGGVN